MQKIEFKLDRSGAELEAESKMECYPAPVHYDFDSPFLLYMKKRDALYPFLVIWVDNPELLVK